MSHRTFRALRFTLPEVHLIRDSAVIAWLKAVFSYFSGSATDYMPVNSLHKYLMTKDSTGCFLSKC